MAKRRPSGDGMVRKRDDGRWEGRIVVGHKENGASIFRYIYADTQKELSVKLRQYIDAYKGVDLTEESRMTLAEWLDRWLNEYMPGTVRPNTLDGYRRDMKNHVKPYLGQKPLARITATDIRRLYDTLKTSGRKQHDANRGPGLSPATVQGIHTTLHHALRTAVDEGLIPGNPADKVTPPKVEKTPKRIIGYDDKGLPKTKNVLAKTKKECQQKLKALRESMNEEMPKPVPVKAGMTFGEWMDLWYRDFCKPGIRPKTQADYENRIYQHIIPELGNIPLTRLTQSDLQQFYTRLKEGGRLIRAEQNGAGLSDRMVKVCHVTCRMALDTAVEQGLIVKNPAATCKAPATHPKEMQILTLEEIQRLLIQTKEDGCYELLLLELSTGLRRGEILALQWDDLDCKAGELRIERQVQRVNGQLTVSVPKTNASSRVIVLPATILNVLMELKMITRSRWMFPSPRKEDSPLDPAAVRKKLSRTLERAGCKHVRFHDLRHTFSTMALEHGMDIKTLSAIIGHVSSHTTLNVYAHVTDEMQARAAEKIDRGIAGAEALPETAQKKETPRTTFKAVRGKYRKPGTGHTSQISENLWEGRYSPKVNGRRMTRNVYAHSEEECEEKLVEMICEMKAEIATLKSKLKAG